MLNLFVHMRPAGLHWLNASVGRVHAELALVKLHWAAITPVGESSKSGEIPAVTLFQSSSLYERVLPKAGPEHTVSTEKREKEKKRQSNKQAQHNSSTPLSLCKDKLYSGLQTTSRQKSDREKRRVGMIKSARSSQKSDKI